jgi:hypothetical protein
VGLFEDPVPKDDIVSQRAIREQARRPIATHFREELFVQQMRENAIDGYVVDGGVTRGLNLGTTLASHNKNFFLQYCGTGITLAMSLHVASVLTHARWPAVTMSSSFQEDLLAEPIRLVGGFARVPDGPGLGVQVDDGALDRLRVATNAIPELADRIYSVTVSPGRVRHYTTPAQLWADFELNGTLPVQAPGTSLAVREDDGSRDFRALFDRVSRAPLWDVTL